MVANGQIRFKPQHNRLGSDERAMKMQYDVAHLTAQSFLDTLALHPGDRAPAGHSLDQVIVVQGCEDSRDRVDDLDESGLLHGQCAQSVFDPSVENTGRLVSEAR